MAGDVTKGRRRLPRVGKLVPLGHGRPGCTPVRAHVARFRTGLLHSRDRMLAERNTSSRVKDQRSYKCEWVIVRLGGAARARRPCLPRRTYSQSS